MSIYEDKETSSHAQCLNSLFNAGLNPCHWFAYKFLWVWLAVPFLATIGFRGCDGKARQGGAFALRSD